MTKSTTHTVRYEQPGILSALPYNKVAQFALGCVVILVAWKMFTAGWFSMFSAAAFNTPEPGEGLGTGSGIVPFLIDAVCLVGLAGFALLGLIGGAIGPLFGGLPEWLAGFWAGSSANTAAIGTALLSGLKTSSGQDLTVPQLIRIHQKQITALQAAVAELQAKTDHLEPPPPPEPPKSKEDLLLEQLAAMQEKLDALDTPATKTTSRSKSNG